MRLIVDLNQTQTQTWLRPRQAHLLNYLNNGLFFVYDVSRGTPLIKEEAVLVVPCTGYRFLCLPENLTTNNG